MPQEGLEREQEKLLLETRSRSLGTVFLGLMRIIYFANVSNGSSQEKSLLGSDDS